MRMLPLAVLVGALAFGTYVSAQSRPTPKPTYTSEEMLKRISGSTATPKPSYTPEEMLKQIDGGSPTLAAPDVYLPSDTVSKPVLKTMVQPRYTSEAMLRRIRGEVTLQVDVRPDGTVGTVALVRSLFPGLDEEAVKAAKQWQFAPGEKDGKPVTVRTEAVVVFNLR